ncbi:MAG: hypothetical protein PHD53_00880 [Methylococcales bacterium]|nr:hypothetical protein [Methylococcales bacterium]
MENEVINTKQQEFVDFQASHAVSLPTLPNLQDAVEGDIALGSNYWTPVDVGEFKRGIVCGIEIQEYEKVDEVTGEFSVLNLPVVVFAEQRADLSWSKISNGSKRLVATIEQSIKSGSITPMRTACQIKYLGKVKNSTNSFKSDTFEVKTLII